MRCDQIAEQGGTLAVQPVGTVLAGLHTDLNALSMHGAARYGGLFVWDRAGTKRAVALPRGCLLQRLR